MKQRMIQTDKCKRDEPFMMDINEPRRLSHPLQAKFDSGELKSVNHWTFLMKNGIQKYPCLTKKIKKQQIGIGKRKCAKNMRFHQMRHNHKISAF